MYIFSTLLNPNLCLLLPYKDQTRSHPAALGVTDSNLTTNCKTYDGKYDFLKALDLIDDDEIKIGDDDANDEFSMGDDTDDDDDDEFWMSDDGWWDPSKPYTGHDGHDYIGTNFFKPDLLVIIILFSRNSPGAFRIFLNRQRMNYLMHFLNPLHLENRSQCALGSISRS